MRSSVLIETLGKAILIDSGPDFRYQMLRANIVNLDAILYTHEHKDHTGGLDDIRAYNYINKRPMDIYAEKRVQQSLRREFYYIFSNKKYPGVPEITMHTITDDPFTLEGIPITPIRLFHHQLLILGFRIYDFVYMTDVNLIP